MQGFLHCVWPLRMHFCAIFLLKKWSVENDHTGKKIILVLKTTFKKVFIKYQVNARIPSLCLVSENAVFRGRKRRKKKLASPLGILSEDGMPQLLFPLDKLLYMYMVGTNC